MYFGNGNVKPITNDIIVGNVNIEGGSNDQNGIWFTSDTSSVWKNNEFQDSLFGWGAAHNDVESNTVRSLELDGASSSIANNVVKENTADYISLGTDVTGNTIMCAHACRRQRAQRARSRMCMCSSFRCLFAVCCVGCRGERTSHGADAAAARPTPSGTTRSPPLAAPRPRAPTAPFISGATRT